LVDDLYPAVSDSYTTFFSYTTPQQVEMGSDGDGVNDFLQRIRELGDKRDREDEERARRLEQEIIAGREARRARRDGKAHPLGWTLDSGVFFYGHPPFRGTDLWSL